MKRINRMLIVFYIASLLLAGLLFLTTTMIKIDLFKYGFVLPQFGAVLAFILVKIKYKDREFKLGLKFRKADIVPLLTVILLPILFIVIIRNSFEVNPLPSINILSIMIVGITLGAWGEEAGWRGFMQPALERSFNPFVASIIVGLLWSVWHVSHFALGPLFMLFFTLDTITSSLIYTWYIREKRGYLIPTVLHAVSNLGVVLIGAPGGKPYYIYSLFYFLWAVILVVSKRKYFFSK